MKIRRAGGMRRKSRSRTGCSLVLLGVHDLCFALPVKPECKETRASECLTPCHRLIKDVPNAVLSLKFCQDAATLYCFLKTPALVDRLFTNHLVFNWRCQKEAPEGPSLYTLVSSDSLMPPGRPCWFDSPSCCLVCFLPTQGFALLILNRVQDWPNTILTHLPFLPLETIWTRPATVQSKVSSVFSQVAPEQLHLSVCLKSYAKYVCAIWTKSRQWLLPQSTANWANVNTVLPRWTMPWWGVASRSKHPCNQAGTLFSKQTLC